MNREIKFKRVFQHEETGRMCEIMWGNIDSNDEPYKYFEGFKSPAHISGYTVVADMQFTGLKDKNGKEIYEGDIIANNEFPHLLIVGFNIGCASFCASKTNSFSTEKCYWFENDICVIQDEWEIIGNIYENPERLRGEETK